MSAQEVMLEPRLQQAVSQGAISVAEAWCFQDLIWLAPDSATVQVPEQLQGMLGRMWLLEEPPANSLPI